MAQSEKITMCCEPELAQRIRAAAAADRREVSAWIRLVVEDHLSGSDRALQNQIDRSLERETGRIVE